MRHKDDLHLLSQPLLSFIQIMKNNNFSHELFSVPWWMRRGKNKWFPIKSTFYERYVELNFPIKGTSDASQSLSFRWVWCDAQTCHKMNLHIGTVNNEQSYLWRQIKFLSSSCTQMQPDFKSKLKRNSLRRLSRDNLKESFSITTANFISHMWNVELNEIWQNFSRIFSSLLQTTSASDKY